MKKLVLKESVEKVLVIIMAISIVLLMTTLENEWTLNYGLFALINVSIVTINGLILAKFGKKN